VAKAVVDFALEDRIGTAVVGDPKGLRQRSTSSTCPRCLNEELPTRFR